MLAYAKTWHIGIVEYSEFFHDCITTHIQSSIIFTEIGKSCVNLEIQSPGHTDNPGILRTLTYLQKQVNPI